MIQNMIINKEEKCQKLKINNELDDTIETMRNIKFIAAKIKKLNIKWGLCLNRLVTMKNKKNEEKHIDKQTNQSVQ